MNEKITKKQNKIIKVYVAISGGVDSSVALALLRDRGYQVTGVYFKTYKPDGNREYCRQQGMDAQAVCKKLGVPFKVFDLQEEYRQRVFDYMINGYKKGQTPNPDIICNKEIKFGIFARRAFDEGADFIATGHYARLRRKFSIFDFQFSSIFPLFNSAIAKPRNLKSKKRTRVLLLKAKDSDKDQTYFLSQISGDILKRTLFPIGEYKKSEVRALAKKYNLHTADKKDSQGICFIGQEMNVKNFLKRYIKAETGNVLNVQGEIIGTHHGAKMFTIGERRGFVINPEYKIPNMPRLFVIKKDIIKNTITIGTKEELENQQRKNASLLITQINWIYKAPKENKKYTCRIRHRGDLYTCTLSKKTARGKITKEMKVNFIDIPYAPASGQFLAVYDGDMCLGGGVII